MAAANGGDSVPEAWDDISGGTGDAGGEMDSGFGKKPALNVDAPVFMPGQNVFAPAFQPFVPTVPNSSSPESTNTDNAGDQDSPQKDGTQNSEDAEADNQKEPEEWDQEDEKPEADQQGTEDVDDEKEEDEDEEDEDDDEPIVVPKKKPAEAVKIRKDHINVVFIGHVDAGKSTIGGHLLYLTGMVDKRTLEKYEREAKEKNRETWYLSWALDTNTEEREKGKTVEVGRAYFETEKKHFTVLDAPGHKSFVPNMICGASQADLAILVISARRGEFETGFERGGQTREHAMLVKTAGVRHLIVLINKMDDPTVNWDVERYNECKEKLLPYLKKCGFNPKTDIYFLPCSGLTGAYLRYAPEEDLCPWYRGPSLLEYLDSLPSMNRENDAPVRVPVVDRYKAMGTIMLGKIESGVVTLNQKLMLMPNKTLVKVVSLTMDEEESEDAFPGENVNIKVTGVEEEDVSPGFVLCSPENLCHTGRIFDAQIVILEHKSIICAGYSCMLHIHTCAEEVTIKILICLIDKKTGEKTQVRPRFIKQDQVGVARMMVNGGMICLETFKDFPQMGRFTLRDEGKTIAIGKVLKIID
ncbi:eukaryotic peptide chain release factor GTP-binding subunit ERF3A-like isoform X2 [Littorina saxatilis]|uniref:eukaryotic peptide chain release factor GTP-binding subunit ERF3A-like isoform X2 n=1 Tax=Littorina saxatilis TaxID=31220 RepID=UPI0038B44770